MRLSATTHDDEIYLDINIIVIIRFFYDCNNDGDHDDENYDALSVLWSLNNQILKLPVIKMFIMTIYDGDGDDDDDGNHYDDDDDDDDNDNDDDLMTMLFWQFEVK